MKFSRSFRIFLVLFFFASILGCRRSISTQEKKVRDQLREALRQHHFEQALPLARRIVQIAPRENGAWSRLAQAEAGIDDLIGLRQTLHDWKTAVSRTSPKYDEYRGDLEYRQGRQREAVAAWNMAASHRHSPPRVFVKIARVEEVHGRWPEAIVAWTGAIKLQPRPASLVRRALCYRHLHRWDAAFADLRQAAALAPDDQFVRRTGLRFERLAKFLPEVRELDRQLAALPNDTGLYADRALLFLRAGDPELALEDSGKAALLAPETVRPPLFAALARQSLHQSTPDNSLVRQPPRLETLSPQFLESISRLDAQLLAEPTNAELHSTRAWHLNESGQPQLALLDAEKAIAADPKSAPAQVEAAYALTKLRRSPEAYDRIKRATELDSNFSTAWQYRGELEMKQGDYTGAADSLSRALAINQTAAALEKREEGYRRFGLLAKAEEDHKTLGEIRAAR